MVPHDPELPPAGPSSGEPMGRASDRPLGESHEHSVSELKDALERWQIDGEQEKVTLARTLHDDLGGLLVGAIMDIGWISLQAGHSEPVREKLARATGLLRAAIDMKRELIENLRPTLLDNVGLFSTLRWHLKASCDRIAVPHAANFPPAEINLPPDLKIGVFRIFQAALKHVLSEGRPRELSLDVEVKDNTLHCHLRSTPVEVSAPQNARGPAETSIRFRVQRTGGTLRWLKEAGAQHLHLQFPLTG